MKFEVTRPCSNCPFLKEGGIRLSRARAKEIGGMMLSRDGGTFPCHKTTVDTEDGEDRMVGSESLHCAGALIFAEKQGFANQMMRIAERLGIYDASKLDKASFGGVFDSLKQMVRAQFYS